MIAFLLTCIFTELKILKAGVVMCLVSHRAEELHLHQDMRAMCVPPARGLTAHLDLSGKYMGHRVEDKVDETDQTVRTAVFDCLIRSHFLGLAALAFKTPHWST